MVFDRERRDEGDIDVNELCKERGYLQRRTRNLAMSSTFVGYLVA